MDDSNMQDGMRIAYTPYPPNQLCSKEVANSDVAAAGPTARTTEATTWATPFTASLLRAKLTEVGLLDQVRINVVPMAGRFTIGPFDLELVTLTHSIPEPNAVVLRTAAGTVLHTGDWKLDPDPLIGAPVDEDALRRLGDEGVLAMVCDSTNALRPGSSGSEAALRA